MSPRLIILSLPLLLLWLVWPQSSDTAKSADSVVASERRARVDSDSVSHSYSLSEEMGASGTSGFFGERIGHLSSLSRSKKERPPLPTDEKGRKLAVEQIWDAISPKYRNALNEEDEQGLRSYISDLISPAAAEVPWLCWGEDVPLEKVAAYHEVEALTGLDSSGISLFANQFLNLARWTITATDGSVGGVANQQGEGVTLTWSIVPDGTTTPATSTSSSQPSDFRAWIASIYGGSTTEPAENQDWFVIFETAIAAMGDTCGVTLVYEPNDDGSSIQTGVAGVLGRRGDIRLSARAIDGNGGTLAFAFAPNGGDMVFDSTDSSFNNTTFNSRTLFNVIAHELGHSLGLDHVCPINRTKLMEPTLSTSFRGPQFDESQSLQRQYGDPLEVSESSDDNDSVGDATELELVLDEAQTFQWLSIDDNTDVDFFRFTALRNQELNVLVTPGDGTYLEGAQLNSGACTAGTDFESSELQNLTLEVFDESGSTLLTSSTEGELGEQEGIENFLFEEDGTYLIRINGDTTNAAQLYTFEILLRESPSPVARFVTTEFELLEESGFVKNGILDPNETFRISYPLQNIGNGDTQNLQVGVSASDGVVLFPDEYVISEIVIGETGVLELVFGVTDIVTSPVSLNIVIFDDSGVLNSFEEVIEVGDITRETVFEEGFDETTNLPVNWSSEEVDDGNDWVTSGINFDSPFQSAFVEGEDSQGESILLSPSVTLLADGGILSFRHLYDIETRFDGAVLEASLNSGEWFDLITDDDVNVVEGGYDITISTGFDSPIGGRRAWSGNQNTFRTTTVELPSSWGGEDLVFRWRFVSDVSLPSEGWWVDTITLSTVTTIVEPHRPVFELEYLSGQLDENSPESNALFALATELPLVQDFEIPLEVNGSAEVEDISGNLNIAYPSGGRSVSFSVGVVVDEIVEGDEILEVTIPSGNAGFAAGGNASQSVTLIDLLNLTTWGELFFSDEVDFTEDNDGDGFSELAEYLLGTDPTDLTSFQRLTLVRENNSVLLPLTDLPFRADATLGVEVSENLMNWSEAEFETTEEGLEIDSELMKRFLRLNFSVN